MKRYLIRITTDSGDVYKTQMNKRPTSDELAYYVWELEGECADLEFYKDTISFEIDEVEI